MISDRMIYLIFLSLFAFMQILVFNNIIQIENRLNGSEVFQRNIVDSKKEVYKEHSNIFVDKNELPNSIIFVIADGTGIGHYTLS